MNNTECNFCCNENNLNNDELVYVGYFYDVDPDILYQGYICSNCLTFAKNETDEYKKTFVGLDFQHSTH